MHRDNRSSLGLGRLAVGGSAALALTIIWAHALAGLLRQLGADEAPLAAAALTVGAVLVALAGILSWRSVSWKTTATVAVASAALAVLTVEATHSGAWVASLALLLVGPPVALLGRRLVARLPASFDVAAGRHRWAAAAWLLLAVVAVVQVGRLSTWITDPESDWFLSTRHPFWADHECLPAYVFGAELSERGDDNLYHAGHYPALTRDAAPETAIDGMLVEDPYQYAPQFLLLPRIFTSLTTDYGAIKSLWFGLQSTIFLIVATLLALWVGRRAGWLGALLIPMVLASFPVLHSLQYGQFHITTIALALGALMAFEAKRRALGGSLLGFAIIAKLFPALLLIPLAVQRRWRDLGWTLGAVGALTVAAWVVLGPEPFTAFIEYQLPRLGSGAAFAFADAWPELTDLIVADNQGVAGLVGKLDAMGLITASAATAVWANRVYGLVVVVLVVLASRRLGHATRHGQAIAWLAILGLGSLASAGAWGDYVPLTAVWLLSLLAVRMTQDWRWAAVLVPALVLNAFFLGTSPIGDGFDPQVMTPLSALGALSMFGVFGGVLVAALRPLAAPVRRPIGAMPATS